MTNTHTARNRVYDDITQTIGSTPLVRLARMEQRDSCQAVLLAKLEFFNPLSSIKDRTAFGMLEDAEKSGRLKAGGVLVEPTSGNTGIGLAFLAAVRGYKLILTMPENMSAERRKLLAYLGAEIVLTPADKGMQGAIDKAQEIVEQKDGAIMLQQFANPANPAIHIRSTAPEIWDDTEGEIDVFVAGVGTGGTIQGAGSELKRRKPTVHVVAVEPLKSPVLSSGKAGVHGIQGIGANFIPPILDVSVIDEILSIDDDLAVHYARRLAKEEGILAGISSGAAVAAAMKVAQRQEMYGKTIVVICPDGAERYLSTALFD